MSVRRLADDTVQPDSFVFSDENAGWAERLIGNYPEGRQQSAVIPLLMRAQEQDGWVTRAAIERVADMLRMPLIRVLEVATFYTQFQLKPVGTRAHIQVCGTTPCMLRGSDELKAVCKTKIHPEQFHPNEAGTLSWEEVECLGACVNAPMVMIFKDTYEDLTPERFGEIIDLFEGGKAGEVRPGPQIDRHLSAPIGALTSLTEDYEDRAPQDRTGHGPVADGAAPQGAGAGAAVSAPPSDAGRPDTYAEETDPTIASPGKAVDGNVDEAVETAASIDPSAGADRPGAGATGGTVQGPTGAEEKEDDAETGTTPSGQAAGGELFKGELRAQDGASESEVVPDRVRGGEVGASARPARGAVADLTGRADDPGAAPEAVRDTSDVAPGPVAKDHFESEAQRAPGEAAVADADAGEGTLETRPHRSIGRQPAGLLSEPEGPKDDLQKIKGVGRVIEQKLNELGVFHIRQVAGWDVEELMWIDDHLNFRGRALRDRWVEQARELQAGSSGPAGA